MVLKISRDMIGKEIDELSKRKETLTITISFRLGNISEGGGGTPLYKLYRYVPPQRVWFLSRFGLKTGIDFDHYGLKSGMVFKGTT